MSEDWPIAVWIAVGISIFVGLIFVTTVLFSLGQKVNSALQEDDRRREVMRTYREYNAYDMKDVYCQDVVSAVLKTHGAPYIEVSINGSTYYWQASQAIAVTKSVPVQNATAYSSTAVLTVLDLNKVYYSELIRGDNSEVVGIKFVAR